MNHCLALMHENKLFCRHDVMTVERKCIFFLFSLFSFFCLCRKTRISVITLKQHRAVYVLCATYDVLWRSLESSSWAFGPTTSSQRRLSPRWQVWFTAQHFSKINTPQRPDEAHFPHKVTREVGTRVHRRMSLCTCTHAHTVGEGPLVRRC